MRLFVIDSSLNRMDCIRIKRNSFRKRVPTPIPTIVNNFAVFFGQLCLYTDIRRKFVGILKRLNQTQTLTDGICVCFFFLRWSEKKNTESEDRRREREKEWERGKGGKEMFSMYKQERTRPIDEDLHQFTPNCLKLSTGAQCCAHCYRVALLHQLKANKYKNTDMVCLRRRSAFEHNRKNTLIL